LRHRAFLAHFYEHLGRKLTLIGAHPNMALPNNQTFFPKIR
jgi:hypothetical protein